MRGWRELPLPTEVELTGARVKAAAMRVHREVGAGFRENVYQRCLVHTLRENGHAVRERVSLTVRYRGLELPRAGEADLIVDDQVVVELKARETMRHEYTAQVLGYLRATDLALGFVFNFHAPLLMKGGYARVVHPRYLVAD